MKSTLNDREKQELIRKALEARRTAYAPYSHFLVGAALLAEDGSFYQGGNIENASYGATNCAERTAVFKAVSEGDRLFKSICIVNEDAKGNHDYCPPCGVCRQTLMEFVDPKKFQVILAKSENEYKIYTLNDLLPLGFGPENL